MTDEESWELKARMDRYMSRVATAVAVEADRKFFEALNMSQVEITIGEASTGCPVDDGAILNRIATQGSVAEFAANWQRPEAEYCHFTRGEPENQIQFAFRQNWLEFAKIMEPLKPWAGKRSLEVGAGRGTMSMYFADNGFDVTLLDSCNAPLERASYQFAMHGLKCETIRSDALDLQFADNTFDVVHSYGLLEHFKDHDHVISEQRRVLKSGGCWIAYVPYKPNSRFVGMSAVSIALRHQFSCVDTLEKESVYRNPMASVCINAVAHELFADVKCYDAYPFPMIAPSVEFPFTLNHPDIERAIVDEFRSSNEQWLQDYTHNEPLPCQAFIVWGWKR